MPSTMVINGRYNWKGQTERLVYLGLNYDQSGAWHQFALVDEPGKVWCEVRENELHMLERTPEESTPSVD